MQIKTSHYKFNSYNYTQTPTFQAYMPEKFYQVMEKNTIKFERGNRKILNILIKQLGRIKNVLDKFKIKVSEIFYKKKEDYTEKNDYFLFNSPETHSQKIWNSYTLSRLLTQEKEVEINIENDELQNIVNDDCSHIFIMNHDKQRKDPKLLSFFNALLLREYLYQGKASACPKSKIILNKDILECSDDEKKKLAEQWGAVGIDAALHSSDKMKNGRIMSELVKELSNDEINLFIFPEGRMCAFSNLDPQWKFQEGVGDIVKAVVQRKDEVKVVPLGFAYKKDVGGIHIGEPIYFKKDGNTIKFKNGIVDEKTQDKTYTAFINNAQSENGWYTIESEGTPVNPRESGKYIAGILCENLTASKKLAQESIKDVGTEKDAENPLYTIGVEINDN